MQVFQTDGAPPSSGSSILATIGWTQNNSAALRNKVVEKSPAMVPPFKPTRYSSRHNHAFRRLPVRRGRQRFVGMLQREAVRHHRRERKRPLRRAQKIQCCFKMARFARPRAKYLQLFAGDHLGIEWKSSRIAVMPKHQVFPTVTAH